MDWGLLRPNTENFLLRDELVFYKWVKQKKNKKKQKHHHLNNCGQYRAIKEIPLPFVLSDTDLKSNINLSRRPSFNINSITNMDRNSVSHDSVHRGSFYGRRDFENKHDDTADIIGSVNTNKLGRGTSTLDNVLTRIKSLRNSIHSDESENDDDDDDDEDESENEEDEDDDGYFEDIRHEEF
ncbi:hypothetical protein EDC94DRAFT_511105 [Helicostylum pulchrum]|nr:hypothetical protein EDC94DRAFT_511105 [Helicostylum pulchrum]